MNDLISFCRGPLFFFSIAVFVLGGLRHIIMRVYMKDETPREGCLLREGGLWLAPLRLLFLTGMVLVPLFFTGHIRLWERGTGVSWPALDQPLVCLLTIVTAVLGLVLLVARLAIPCLRASRHPDVWLIPPLVSLTFISGYLLAHPDSHVLPLKPLVLLHVLSAETLLVRLPFSYILACITHPLGRLRQVATGGTR